LGILFFRMTCPTHRNVPRENSSTPKSKPAPQHGLPRVPRMGTGGRPDVFGVAPPHLLPGGVHLGASSAAPTAHHRSADARKIPASPSRPGGGPARWGAPPACNNSRNATKNPAYKLRDRAPTIQWGLLLVLVPTPTRTACPEVQSSQRPSSGLMFDRPAFSSWDNVAYIHKCRITSFLIDAVSPYLARFFPYQSSRNARICMRKHERTAPSRYDYLGLKEHPGPRS